MNKLMIKLTQKIKAYGLLFPLDVALVGATGVGKSSTINRLFGDNVATVGTGVDPETTVIQDYRPHEYFRIHDTAGLGDGLIEDNQYKKDLNYLLSKTITVNSSPKKYGYIDLALVILDGASRDLGTTYKLLQDVVLKHMPAQRIIVGINQADVAMKGINWDYENNRPNSVLVDYLEQKAISIQNRLADATGIKINKPIYYSAYHNYNIDVLFNELIDKLPLTRRIG